MELLNLLGAILKSKMFTLKNHAIKTTFSLQHNKLFELRYMMFVSWMPCDLVIKTSSSKIRDKIFGTK